jgi:hypothetical protein
MKRRDEMLESGKEQGRRDEPHLRLLYLLPKRGGAPIRRQIPLALVPESTDATELGPGRKDVLGKCRCTDGHRRRKSTSHTGPVTWSHTSDREASLV